MRTSWQLTKWRGVPVILQWTVFLGLPWFYFRHQSLEGMAVAFGGFCLLLVVHEFGHALVAKWRKVRVHEIRLMFLHGHCRHAEPYHEADDIWIAWGGVAAQLVILLMALAVSELLRVTATDAYLFAQPLFRILIETNFVIMVVNLLPIPSFDGMKAWRILRPLRAKLNPHRWIRHQKLRRQSKNVAADIIERLKKR
jgi:Zn-dependent protease